MKYLFVVIFLYGCHPINDKLNIKNSDNDAIYCRFIFESERIDELLNTDRSKMILIGGNNFKKLIVFENLFGNPDGWEAIFNEQVTDSLILFCVIPKVKIDSIQKRENINPLLAWNKLYKSKSFLYKAYSLKDFQQRDFKINYPADGFKKDN